jgi:hypothetical protein
MGRRITRAEAQRRFICALETLCDRDRSPLKRLSEEFYSEWKAAFSNPDSRYVSARQREQAVYTARGILKQWAAACNLVSADSVSTPDWLIDYAEAYLKELERSGLGAAAHGMLVPQRPQRVTLALPSNQAGRREALWLPMPNPEPLFGESWVQYRRRACKALKVHWKAGQQGHKKPRSVGHEHVGRRSSVEGSLDHSGWFILYQCCGWSLKRIGGCSWYDRRGGQNVEPTIWQGIQGIAEQAGLKAIRKRPALKK